MEIDGMTITYGDLVECSPCGKVPYCVERANGRGGVDFAEGCLPTCMPKRSEGFTESELWDIGFIMRDNKPLIYAMLRKEGPWA